VAELIKAISELAEKRSLRVETFSGSQVKKAFAEYGATNKYEIAVAIDKRFPELAPRLPRFRKPWMSEDYRMSIFDAVGLGFCSLSQNRLHR
jgi:hypothetical protein